MRRADTYECRLYCWAKRASLTVKWSVHNKSFHRKAYWTLIVSPWNPSCPLSPSKQPNNTTTIFDHMDNTIKESTPLLRFSIPLNINTFRGRDFEVSTGLCLLNCQRNRAIVRTLKFWQPLWEMMDALGQVRSSSWLPVWMIRMWLLAEKQVEPDLRCEQYLACSVI